jgi:nitrogen PTS system EIIA component
MKRINSYRIGIYRFDSEILEIYSFIPCFLLEFFLCLVFNRLVFWSHFGGLSVLTSNYEETLTENVSSYLECPSNNITGYAVQMLKSRDKFGAIREIVNQCPVFSLFNEDEHRETFISEIFKREELCTTGIGHNVAIPHGKSCRIQKVMMGLGVSKEGIDFGAIDGEPVHLVLVIGSNPSEQVQYLKSLAYVMNYLKNPLLRSALKDLSFSYTGKKEDSYSRFMDIMKSQIFTG